MARPGETTYEIARASGVCAATGAALEPGEVYIAALVERDGEEGLQRLDYSLSAWDGGARPGGALRLFGHWRARYEPGESKRRPLIDNESMIDLFEQMEGAEDPSRRSFRYILSLLLIRKRVLRHEGTRRDGGRAVMLLKRAGAPEGTLYEVQDPGMDDAQVSAAIEQLGSVMAV